MGYGLEDAHSGRIDFSDIVTGEKMPPLTPGRILKNEFLEPMEMSAYSLAQRIDVPFNRITEIINGKRAITADTALRLGKVFSMSAGFWMNLQVICDLRATREEIAPALEAIKPVAA